MWRFSKPFFVFIECVVFTPLWLVIEVDKGKWMSRELRVCKWGFLMQEASAVQ